MRLVCGAAPRRALVTFAAIVLTACSSDLHGPPVTAPPEQDPLLQIRALPNVLSASEVVSRPGSSTVPSGYRTFDVTFDQPVDHDHPEGAHFSQRVHVSHRSTRVPVALSTSGYLLLPARGEIAASFATNQISVEHRYFGFSTPNDPTFTHLSARQAAYDFHAIVRSFKSMYTAPWIGTGASKGGETVLFHRAHFPDDTVATVAYVTPFLTSRSDARFATFLATVGGDAFADCRRRLIAFQRRALERRAEIIPLIEGTYERLGGIDAAFDFGVFELAMGFWQYGIPTDPTWGCPAIPSDHASAAVFAAFLEHTGSLHTNIDDESLDVYAAYYVQAARELGAYQLDLSPFDALTTRQAAYTIDAFVPAGVDVPFDPRAIADASTFVATRGERILLVYGELDPWSAAAIDLGGARDSFRYVAPGANHGASIRKLRDAERASALETIARWLGLPAKDVSAQGFDLMTTLDPSATSGPSRRRRGELPGPSFFDAP